MACNCSKTKRIVGGAVKLAKAAMSYTRAPAEVVEARRAICRQCPHAIPCTTIATKFCRCEKCGCFLKAKTYLSEEACPVGKWSAF